MEGTNNYNNQSLETRLAVIERDVAQRTEVIRELKSNDTKLTEVCIGIKELLAVHDQKLTQREKTDLSIFSTIEKQKEEYTRAMEKIDSRIDAANKAMQNELSQELEKHHEELKDHIDDLKKEHKESLSKLETKLDSISGTAKIDNESLAKRVSSLERWKWILAGVALAAGLLLGHLGEISSIFGFLGKL